MRVEKTVIEVVANLEPIFFEILVFWCESRSFSSFFDCTNNLTNSFLILTSKDF